MPANDKMPPGSFVLPQGSLPGGQLRLALPSQLPLQLRPHLPLSQPPKQLHASARPGQSNSTASLVEPASSCQPLDDSQLNGREIQSVADVENQSAGTNAAAACQPEHKDVIGSGVQGSKQAIGTSALGHEVEDSKQAIGTSALGHEVEDSKQAIGTSALGHEVEDSKQAIGTSALGHEVEDSKQAIGTSALGHEVEDSKQAIGTSALGHEVEDSKQAIGTSALGHEVGDSKQREQGSNCFALRDGSRVWGHGVNNPVSAGDEQGGEDVSMAASEGTSMLGEPPLVPASTDSSYMSCLPQLIAT